MTSNDRPLETPAEARARRRAELPPPGTVQEEAALLVDLLSQRRWAPPGPGMPSGRAGEPAADHTRPGDEARGEGPSSGSGERHENGSQRPGTDGQHDCTCGGRTPAACAVCPVCQVIAFVQQVNPETIDKVADFVGFAATALRDLATAQRQRQSDGSTQDGTDSGAGHAHETGHPPAPHGDPPS